MPLHANYPRFKAWKANGSSVASGYYLYTYESGTTTPKATYADSALASANANPIVLDANGEAVIFLGSGAYRFDLKTPAGALIWTFDPIQGQASAVESVDSISDLRSLSSQGKTFIQVLGYYAPGDGGGGLFWYDTTSSTADDTGVVITPDSAPATGRWKRVFSGEVNIRWYGAKGDGSTDDTTPMTKARDYVAALTLGGVVYFPACSGGYRFTSNPNFGSKVHVRCEPGARFTSTATALTFGGGFTGDPHSQHFSSTIGTVTFGAGYVPPVFNPKWWGTGDAATNAAMVSASSSGGGLVELDASTYTGTIELVLKSNVTLKGAGRGVTLLDHSARTGTFTILSAASSVSNAHVRDLKVKGQSGATDLATGLSIAGTNISIEGCEVQNCKHGVTALATASQVSVNRNRFTWTSGVGNWAVLFNGTSDSEAKDNWIIGTDVNLGVNRGISVKNGGKLYGAPYVTITGNRVKNQRNIGIGGYPDDAVTIDGAVVNYRTIEFSKTASYTSAVAGDIGKAVHGSGATGRGVLVAYDNAQRLWLISLTSGSFTAGDSITIPTGTGAGTQNANFAPYFGISGSSCVIAGNTCSGGVDASIGTGIAVDDLWDSSISNNVCTENVSRGIFLGDGPSYGTVLAGNVCSRNNSSGIDTSRAKDVVILGNVCRRNGLSGIRSEPAVTGGCDGAVVVGNMCLENGVSTSGALDAGIGGTFNASVILGNLTSRNQRSGIYLVNGSKNTIIGNMVADNNYDDTVENDNGIYLDGNSDRNIIAGNNVVRHEDATLRQRNALYIQSGGDNNLALGNILEPNYLGLTDAGSMNQLVQNRGELSSFVFRKLTLSASGYTNAVAGDIGKTVVGGTTGATGTLTNYNNTTRIWTVSLVSGNFSTTEAVTITTGTGAGTLTANAAPLAQSPYTLADGDTVDLESFYGELTIIIPSNLVHGIFALQGSGNTVHELEDGSGSFSTVKDTASMTNVYYDSASGKYRIQNNSGGSRTYYLLLAGGKG